MDKVLVVHGWALNIIQAGIAATWNPSTQEMGGWGGGGGGYSWGKLTS